MLWKKYTNNLQNFSVIYKTSNRYAFNVLQIEIFEPCCGCCDPRILRMGIAGVDLLFGLSIFFLVGTDYEDCVIIYPPAIIAVLAGGLLFYGSLYYNKAATMVYLILSMMLIVFFGIASVILFTRFQKMATIIGSIFLFLGLLRTYFWCLVYIFFKSLKKQSDHSLKELIQMGINIS